MKYVRRVAPAQPTSNRIASAGMNDFPVVDGKRSCPICGHSELRRAVGTPRLLIGRCPRCGHHVAEHRTPSAAVGIDYHRQYEQGEFLESLAAMRRRQAEAILQMIRAEVGPPDGLLDFGAGRGWFLRQASAEGIRLLAGADTSSESIAALRERGNEGVLIAPPTDTGWDLSLHRLSFRPRVMTLLDVVEHFPADRLFSMFAEILDALRPEIQLVVVKVPVADGILYRLARFLARARVYGPLEQLYQVGTYPPHLNYFTRRSLDRFLAAHALRAVDGRGLLEFAPSTLGTRVVALRHVPRTAVLLLGATAALVARRTWQDSYVVLARPEPGADRTTWDLAARTIRGSGSGTM